MNLPAFTAAGIELITAFLVRLLSLLRALPGVQLASGGSLPADGPIAILAPHSDDEIIGCFHFIEHAAARYKVDVFVVTVDADPVVAIRRKQESIAALATAGIASTCFWGFADGRLAASREQVVYKLQEIRDRYALVLCPAPNDRTPDHAVLAACAASTIEPEKLLWYRSTWLTFPLQESDLIFAGNARDKVAALRKYQSQCHLALLNAVRLSALEAAACGAGYSSVEGFRFAASGKPEANAFNSLSYKSALRLRSWLCASCK